MHRKPPLAAMVAAALDPAFSGTPFQAGQTGEPWRGTADPTQPTWPPGPASVIWCAPYDELQQTHPLLPQARGQDDQIDIACVDFTVEFDAAGTLTMADLEAEPLAKTLIAVGMDREGRAAAGLLGRPAREVCGVLPSIIATLLGRVSA